MPPVTIATLPVRSKVHAPSSANVLRFQAEFGSFEGVFLRHSGLGAVQNVQDELTEKAKADLAGNFHVLLAFTVN